MLRSLARACARPARPAGGAGRSCGRCASGRNRRWRGRQTSKTPRNAAPAHIELGEIVPEKCKTIQLNQRHTNISGATTCVACAPGPLADVNCRPWGSTARSPHTAPATARFSPSSPGRRRAWSACDIVRIRRLGRRPWQGSVASSFFNVQAPRRWTFFSVALSAINTGSASQAVGISSEFQRLAHQGDVIPNLARMPSRSLASRPRVSNRRCRSDSRP